MDARHNSIGDVERLMRSLTVGSLVRIPNAGTTATVLNLGAMKRDDVLLHRVLVSWWDGCHRYEDWLSVVELEVIQ